MADRIGEFLVEIGAMSDSQVIIVINHQKAGDQRLFGEIAMGLGYLADNEPIDKFLEYQEKQPPFQVLQVLTISIKTLFSPTLQRVTFT